MQLAACVARQSYNALLVQAAAADLPRCPLPRQRAQEAKAKETIASLKAEVAHLSKLIEQGGGLSVAEERTLNELMAQKEELARERDAQVGGC